MTAYAQEDVGNIISLEHVNLQVPDQSLAMLFYVVGLGFTRDPYLNVGLENMWVNVGEQQFHLPTRTAQRIHGHIGLVVPDIDALKKRLLAVEERLKNTQFRWSAEEGYVAITCPWGNRFRCYSNCAKFGDVALGLVYVNFFIAQGTAGAIARFYDDVLGAPSVVDAGEQGSVARVKVGRDQWLQFEETRETRLPYDGHHIAIYVVNFSRPYGLLKSRGLITEDVRNHQFRFKELIDPRNGDSVFLLEHEVRSLHHPMFHRSFVIRDPEQSQRHYRRGRDTMSPFRD